MGAEAHRELPGAVREDRERASSASSTVWSPFIRTATGPSLSIDRRDVRVVGDLGPGLGGR